MMTTLMEWWDANHRAHMPESSKHLDGIRAVFGDPARVRYEENGRIAEWSPPEPIPDYDDGYIYL